MFNRPNERQDLAFHLDQGRSVLMLAPRRIGKTWLIKQVAVDLRAAGWMAILCDVEGMSEETEFLRHLCRAIESQETLRDQAAGRTRQLLHQIFTKDLGGGWQAALGNMDWASFAETLVRGLDAREQRTAILVDELALFVAARMRKDEAAAQKFLYALRALAQRYPNVRWVFTGSIGLDTIARRGGIGGALNHLQVFPLEPFSLEAARSFLDDLSLSGQLQRPFALDDAGFAHFVRELGWLSPYYLEHLAQQVRASGPAGPDGRGLASLPDVDAAFAAMLAPALRTYFVHWEEHLDKNFPAGEAASLRLLLDACAGRADGELIETLLARLGAPPVRLSRRALLDLLSVLVTDGYLAETAEGDRSRVRFRSGLLRRYWLRYHAA